MGIFDKIMGQFIDVIEFMDESQSTLVHRFDRQGNEIKNGAQLIVRESQVAIFVKEGKLSKDDMKGDSFQSGRYELTTNNLPILSTLYAWKHGFNSPFKAEVYFVNTKTFTGNKWGTKNPIMLRDPEFGVVRLRAFGTYAFRVSDPLKLVFDMAGTNSHFDIENLEEQLRSLIVSEFTDALGEAKIAALDLAANYKEFGDKIRSFLNEGEGFKQYGLEITKFIIENISLPPEVEQAMDKRSQMNVLGNLDQYTKFQTANAMEQAAKNPGDSGGAMGAGLGMGVGIGMAQQMSNAFNPQGQSVAPPPIPGSEPFYIAVGGKQLGPLSQDQLKSYVTQGQLTKDTLVWKQGMANWIKASEVSELSSIFGAVPPPLPPS
ncbi:MAG: SPFH domain-containing protein [Leptospiraceae bacterium]|nr:SPFH domain-containing protein [Leptospiraceae bacterium]